tara:strand:- start:140 stop:736 length:597 start_codon:yes stop_codon:yes gene_type:complete
MKLKLFIIVTAIVGAIFIFTPTLPILSPSKETPEPKQSAINEKNSTAMICNIEDKNYSQNDWIGLKISPTLNRVSYIYFGGLNGQGSPYKSKWLNDIYAFFTTTSINISSRNSHFSDWKDDKWSFELNRETLRASSETFVGKFGWDFEYSNTWQCEIAEHRQLNIKVEELFRKMEERRQKNKELQKIEEEEQLEKNKI